MYISKAKITGRYNLLKIVLPIVAIITAIIMYFIVFKKIYNNGGYITYTDDCETLANSFCNIYLLTGEYPDKLERFRSRGGRSSFRRGNSNESNNDLYECKQYYKNKYCIPYYSNIGYAILAHIISVIVLTGIVGYLIWYLY
jgi:hypothetical protein